VRAWRRLDGRAQPWLPPDQLLGDVVALLDALDLPLVDLLSHDWASLIAAAS
jgi:hypothetical protein